MLVYNPIHDVVRVLCKKLGTSYDEIVNDIIREKMKNADFPKNPVNGDVYDCFVFVDDGENFADWQVFYSEGC